MYMQNKLILRRFFEELFNQGNLAAANEIVSETYLNHNAAPGEEPGRTGLTQLVAEIHHAFRDLNVMIEDQLADGDKVITRWTVTAIHQGEFAGIPATGKPIAVTAINIHRVADGQIQEGWLNWDALSFLQQVGAISI